MLKFSNRFFTEELVARAEQLRPSAVEHLHAIAEKRCQGAEYTGWYHWPKERAEDLLQKIKAYKDSLSVSYDTVVVVGIGGSYLGARTVWEALSHEYHAQLRGSSGLDSPNMVFAGQHLSEGALVELFDLLEQKQPIINVISKSGTTTEPSVAFRCIRKYMEKRYGQAAAERIVVTTDQSKGSLRALSDQQGYQTFVVPDDVGGRFSVLTAVGLVPLALAGLDIDKLVAGARANLESIESGTIDLHPVIHYAASRMAAYETGKRMELLSLSEPKLKMLGEWWKQLFGESEGKDGKGLFPASLHLTTDLHSLGQYVQDGPRFMIETFLNFQDARPRDHLGRERGMRVPHLADDFDGLNYLADWPVHDINHAAFEGTRLAHFDGGLPCLEIELGRLDEFHLGELFGFFEVSCGVSAALLGVNPYDQPGVEAYKKNLFGLCGKPGFEQLGEGIRERLAKS